jgi:hypothetical protein
LRNRRRALGNEEPGYQTVSSNNGQLVETFSLVKNNQFVVYRSKSLAQPPIGKLITQAPQKIVQNISF